MGRPNLDPSAPARLTVTELALMRALADGRQLKQAAREIPVSYDTAKSAAAEVRRLLGCSTTAQAVARCTDLGLLHAPPIPNRIRRPAPRLAPRRLAELNAERARIEAAYPATRFDADRWAQAFDERPEMYLALLRSIARGGIQRRSA